LGKKRLTAAEKPLKGRIPQAGETGRRHSKKTEVETADRKKKNGIMEQTSFIVKGGRPGIKGMRDVAGTSSADRTKSLG